MHIQQRGFTLLELSIAIAAAAIIAAMSIPNIVGSINANRAQMTIQSTQMIVDAAKQFRSDNGVWPGNAACTNAVTALQAATPPYIRDVAAANAFGSAITTGCSATAFTVTQNIVADWDSVVANALPSTVITVPAAFTVRTITGLPGSEPGLSSYMSRINTGDVEDNTMRTGLNMGGNAITGVGALSASSVSSTGNVTAGGNVSATSAITAQDVRATSSLRGSQITSTAGMTVGGNVSTGDATTAVTGSFSGEVYTGGWFRTRNNAGLYNQTYGGGWYMTDSSTVRPYNNKGVATLGTILGGEVVASGRATVGEHLEIVGTVTVGDPCATSTLVAKTASGHIATCTRGIWTLGGLQRYSSAGSGYGYISGSVGNRPIIIMVTGGKSQAGCGGLENRYDLKGYVNGNLITWDRDWNSNFAKQGGITFPAPSYSTWAIQSDAAAPGCSGGQITYTIMEL